MPKSSEDLLQPLSHISAVGTALQDDVNMLALETKHQVRRFKSDEVSLPVVCFWHKSLVRSFFAFADGLAFTIREILHADTNSFQLSAKLKRKLDTTKRLPLKRAVPIAFRSLAQVYSVVPTLDTGGEDFRGFKTLTDARDRFVHPKSHADICPLELFPAVSPSLEWFFVAWRDTILACLESLNLDMPPESARSRRFSFRDKTVPRFTAIREAWDAERRSDFVSDLRDVVCPLMEDTGRAMDALGGHTTVTALPKTCTARNLVRTIFSEIEGTVLIAATLLHRYRSDPAPSKELLVGSHHAVRDNVVLTLENFSQAFGIDHQVDRDGDGWQAFIVARELRNRMTHPKSAADLMFQPGDLDALLNLIGWWHSQAANCTTLEPGKLTPP